MNDANDVVSEQFGQRLVDHRRIRLGSQGIAEFPLNHAECTFDVTPLVIVLEVFFPVEAELVKHLLE